jgi:hypothetical protein
VVTASGVAGFWSYARADDTGERGRITELAHRLQEEYAVLTGQPLRLFLDRDDLTWGDNWRESIEEALAGITFLIPIVTPRYFQSEECRRELLTFTRRAESAGLGELLLPILYVEVNGLDTGADDEALASVARIQWEDWRALRLEDVDSPAYRQGVHRLAARLVHISEDVARRPVLMDQDDPGRRLAEASEAIAGVRRGTDEGPPANDSQPGLVDVLAEAEEALPRWTNTIDEMGRVLEEIGALTQDATLRIQQSDAEGKGFAGRLSVARALARALDEPADKLLALGSSYASDLLAVDAGFLTLIDVVDEGLDTEEDREMAREFFTTIHEMGRISAETVGELRGFSQAIEQTAGFSRDLRPTLRRIQDAVRRVTDGQAVIEAWVSRINRVDVDKPST